VLIQTVIFDLGGVLIEDPSIGMVTYFANYFQVDREVLLEALKKYWRAWQQGELSEQTFWQEVTADLHIHNPPYISLWFDGFQHECREHPEVFALLKHLKVQGYTTALLSNTEMPVTGYFRQRLQADVDHFFFSCEMGMRKPEHVIYEKMMQDLECLPEAAVFIDDRSANVEAAVRLGIEGIVFLSSDDLRKQLHLRQINL
jgi:putative hydrolase of the HAD superfamily